MLDEGYSRLRRDASREARCLRWARPCRLKIFFCTISVGELLVLRLYGLLTASEDLMVKLLPPENADVEIQQSGGTAGHRHSRDGARR